MRVRIANRQYPAQQSDLGPCCLGPFGRQQVFKILECLPYGYKIALPMQFAVNLL